MGAVIEHLKLLRFLLARIAERGGLPIVETAHQQDHPILKYAMEPKDRAYIGEILYLDDRLKRVEESDDEESYKCIMRQLTNHRQLTALLVIFERVYERGE